jgi:predicted enzyme related to lactoylglutathione lyase
MNLPINYIELESSDFAQTIAFYESACGWAFQRWGDEYISFSGAGVEGGFRKKGTTGNPEDTASTDMSRAAESDVTARAPSPNRNGALVILFADDLEAAEATIRKAGGTITIPIFSFPGGRRFHFVDPTGNELAVWAEPTKA